jgi:hypothetical protein
MKHDMEKIIAFTTERFLKKKDRERETGRDNMRGVDLVTQFLRELEAVMSETHASVLLVEQWGEKFPVPNATGGGRPDFVTPDGERIEVKASEWGDEFVNVNVNASKNWDKLVKFQCDIYQGTTTQVGWGTQAMYHSPKMVEKPNGRSYYKLKLENVGIDTRWTHA